MKKTLFIITALAALSLASCKKEEKTETIKEISDIRFEVAQPGTKAVKSNWEKGDEIMILFYEKMEVGQQAKLRYDGSVWQVVQKQLWAWGKHHILVAFGPLLVYRQIHLG